MKTSMSQTMSGFDLAEQQRAGSAFLASAVFNPGAEAMLAAQAAMFVEGEGVLIAWLNRRHEAILDMQRLFARMRECRDLDEATQMQQEWIGRAFKRLADDALGSLRAVQTVLGAAVTERTDAARPNIMDVLRSPANDGRPAAAPGSPGLKSAGQQR